MVRTDDKKEKIEKIKKIRKDGDPNDWASFSAHVGFSLLYTLIYGLLGANLIIYTFLTKDKKDNDEFSKKINEYFRIDKEYYNCIGINTNDECPKVYDEIPYKYHDRLPENYKSQGFMMLLFYLFFPAYAPVAAAVSGAQAVSGAVSGEPADGGAPASASAPADVAPAPAPVEGATASTDVAPATASTDVATATASTDVATADGAPAVSGGSIIRKRQSLRRTRGSKMSGGAGLIGRKDIMPLDKYESLYMIQKIYIEIKNWLIESIAGSYLGERSVMHQLLYMFTPDEKDVESSTTKTFKMAFYPLISMLIIFSSYFVGFAHCVYQAFLNNVIYSIILFMGVFFMAMFVGATQFAELTFKLLISPLISDSKEVFTRISEQPQLLILIFSTLVIMGSFDYLDSEICFAMSGFYFCYALYTFYYFVSEKFPQFKISNMIGISDDDAKE
jgi:hypothetical protein